VGQRFQRDRGFGGLAGVSRGIGCRGSKGVELRDTRSFGKAGGTFAMGHGTGSV